MVSGYKMNVYKCGVLKHTYDKKIFKTSIIVTL